MERDRPRLPTALRQPPEPMTKRWMDEQRSVPFHLYEELRRDISGTQRLAYLAIALAVVGIALAVAAPFVR